MNDKKTEYHNTQSGNYKVETHEQVPEESIQVDDIADMLIILTKQTIDNFLQSGHYAELIALYTFYYYTAKWQKSNQIKCTTAYVATGIGWGKDKVKKYKKMLKEYGLITDVQRRNKESNQIEGWFIRINYIFKKTTLESHPTCLPAAGNSHPVGKTTPNALSPNILNALSPNKELYMGILYHWNNQSIRKHREEIFMKKLQKKHRDQIDLYGKNEVIAAINNYSCVFHSKEHYFNHTWSLWDFIARGLDNFVDDAKPIENYRNNAPGSPAAPVVPPEKTYTGVF